jgi:hypothetical protein
MEYHQPHPTTFTHTPTIPHYGEMEYTHDGEMEMEYNGNGVHPRWSTHDGEMETMPQPQMMSHYHPRQFPQCPNAEEIF